MSRYVSRAGTGIDVFQHVLERLDSQGVTTAPEPADQHRLAAQHRWEQRQQRRRQRHALRELRRKRRATSSGFFRQHLHEEYIHAPVAPHIRAGSTSASLRADELRLRRASIPPRSRLVSTGQASSKSRGDSAAQATVPLLGAASNPYPDYQTVPIAASTATTTAITSGSKPGASSPSKLGTFMGVFAPVCSFLWGILIFVRIGFAISQAGVVGTAGMFLLGYTISLLTSLSISAIASNGTVKSGGPYYLISRCLGPEFGGSIGVVFAIGVLLSGALNAIAFNEPLLASFGLSEGNIFNLLPEGYWYGILYNSVPLLICVAICYLGVELFANANTVLTAYVFLAILSILVSFVAVAPFDIPEKHVYFTGLCWDTFYENLWPQFTAVTPGGPVETLRTVFAVIFPACVGIVAGVSMSGDLRKPSKSIPRGTLAGMAVTFVSYLLVVLGLGATTRRHSLYHNYSILQEISFFPPIIALAALFTAFTSTLTSIVVSSKVLQAIGRDAIVPLFSPFGYGGAKTDEPYLAYTASYLLCQLSLFAGDVNVVAPFVTMFYLLTFTIINMACFLLKVSSAPNFRPSFQYFKWWTALLGMLVSCFIMVMVNGLAASLSFLVVYVLFLVIHYTTPPKAWGDVTQSLIYHQVRKFLLRLDARKEHVKFWRPQILLLVHNPRGSYHLIKFCNSLKKGGLYILGHILKGDFQEHLLELRHQQQAWLRFVDVTEIKAFVDITISDSERVGARNLILGCGLGGMRPNIVVMGLYNLGGYRYRLRFHREEDSDSDISDDSYDSALNAIDLPTDQIELETSMSVQDYVCIIEDMMVIRKAVALAYGFNRLHRTCPPPSDSWWSWLYEPSDKKYIDLWPIQMAVDQVGTDATATRVTTANFDSYTMVLQLGTILHMAPYWRTHFTLRVMCFVEHEQDVAEEHRRVASLLESLRIKAVLKVLHLDNGQVATYDLIVQGDASRVETEAVNKLHAVLDQSHDPRSPTAPDTDLESYMCNPVAIPPATPAPTTSSAESHQHPMSAAGDQSSSYLARSRIDFHVPDRLEVAQPNHDTSQRTHDLISQLQRQAGPQGPTASMRIAVPQANGGPLHGTQGLSSSSSSDSEDYWLDWDVDPALSIWGAMDIARDPLPGNETTIVAMDDSPVATPLDHPGSPGVLAPSSPCTAQPSPLPSATHPRQRLEFNDLSSRAQNIIINNLIQLHSKDTAVVFTTLPIPTPGTHQSEESSVQYIEDIELLVNGLPPTLLVHSSSLTVTTSL